MFVFALPCLSLGVGDPRAGVWRELPSEQGFAAWGSCPRHRKAAPSGFSLCAFLISAALKHLRNSFHS